MNRLKGRFAAKQIPGGREYQEDDYGLIERGDPDIDSSEVLLLADGMGGHVSGDTASRIVVKTFVETFHDTEGPIPDRLRACLTAANDALADATDENPALKGMGTTVVAAVISQHGLDWISVGDSLLWLFRDGKLRRLNADHSMAPVLANLVAVGRMTEEEAATDSNRHALRSAVMGDEIHLIDVSSQPVAIRKSDRLLLASDGVMTLEDEEIARIIEDKHDAPLEEVAEALIQAVEEVGRPNQDNTTVLLYRPEADCGEGMLPDEESSPSEDTQVTKQETDVSDQPPPSKMLIEEPKQQSKRVLIGILSGAILLALALLAYWFASRTSDETPAVETTPVLGVEDGVSASQRGVTNDSTFTSSGSETIPKNENTRKENAMNAEDNSGKTPLHYAAEKNDYITAKVLLDQGANPNVTDNKYDHTPLFYAAYNNAHETAEVLLKHGADVNAVNIYGMTPLHNAAGENARETAEVLLKHGADVNAKDSMGETPLQFAVRNNAYETAEVLRRYGGRE